MAGASAEVASSVPTPNASIGAPPASSSRDAVLVQIAAGHDARIVQARLRREWRAPRAKREQIAAIDAHAPERPAQRRRFPRAFDRIVGVDQLHRVIAQQLAASRETPRSRWRTTSPRNARTCQTPECHSGSRQRVAGAHAAADVGRARSDGARFRRVRAPRAELQHRTALRRVHDARRFGGDQRFECDRREQVCFGNLRLRDRRRTVSTGSPANSTVPSGTASTSPREAELRR